MRQIRETVARALRGAKGFTQEDLAIQVNVHRTVISRAENGHMHDELFADILDACGGVPFIDRLIEMLRAAREWHDTRQRIGPLLYA